MKAILFIRANKMVLIGSSLLLVGIIGFLPFRWLQTNHLIFGLLATSTLINLSFIIAGLLLLNQSYMVQGHPLVSRTKLYQGIGVWFALLAIGGFFSLPFWPHLWLNLFTNSVTSDALYAIIAVYGLTRGFWSLQNAHVEAQNTPSALNIIPPQSSNQQ